MSALYEVALPEIAADVLAGLSSIPKRLPPKLFYDARGSELFEAITRLPEYYLTRSETEILRRSADEMAAQLPPNLTVVELGAGTATKTQLLLNALARRQGSVRYVPVDVSHSALRQAELQLRRACPGVGIAPYVADFTNLSFLARTAAPRLVMYIGSSIGNFEPEEAIALLRGVRRQLGEQDHLLLGTDLVKSSTILKPAYDDAAGVTAEFNRNMLARLNRELEGDFDLASFRHLARWNGRASRMEMYLESTRQQVVHLRTLGLRIGFAEGELLHTENSYKYTAAGVARMLTRSGFERQLTWTDVRGWFAVHLARVGSAA